VFIVRSSSNSVGTSTGYYIAYTMKHVCFMLPRVKPKFHYADFATFTETFGVMEFWLKQFTILNIFAV